MLLNVVLKNLTGRSATKQYASSKSRCLHFDKLSLISQSLQVALCVYFPTFLAFWSFHVSSFPEDFNIWQHSHLCPVTPGLGAGSDSQIFGIIIQGDKFGMSTYSS